MTKPVPIKALKRDVYWVPRELMDPTDPKPGRPVVVIEQAAGVAGRVRVVSRTRHLARGGVASPPDANLRLNDDGCFSDEYSVDAALFTDPPVEYRGQLSWDAFDDVCAEFE